MNITEMLGLQDERMASVVKDHWAGWVGVEPRLGVVGDPAHTGKPVGDDLIEGKPTVLLSLAQRRFSPHWQSRLDRVGSASCTPGLAAELAAEMVRCGVVAEVEDMIAAAVRLGLAAC